MAIVLKPKKSETASAVPTTGDLAVGEICMNVADRKIYTRKSDNSIVVVSSHVSDTVGGDLTGTVGNAQIGANTVGIAELNVADGSNLQVLTTNGSGTLSGGNSSGGPGGPDGGPGEYVSTATATAATAGESYPPPHLPRERGGGRVLSTTFPARAPPRSAAVAGARWMRKNSGRIPQAC